MLDGLAKIYALCLMYCSKSSGFKPLSISFRVLLIMPRYLDTHFPSSAVGGHSRITSCCSTGCVLNRGHIADTLLRKHFLFNSNVLHSKIPCNSVSHSPLSQYILYTHVLTKESPEKCVFRIRP